MLKEKKKSNEILDKVISRKDCLQFLPQRLQPFTTNKYIEFEGKRIKSAYLIDILNDLLFKYYNKKENLFNISAVVLKEKYGFNYNLYMNFLREQGFVELVKKHMKGKNARIYKICDDVLTNPIIRIRNSDSIVVKRYKNAVSTITERYFESNLINVDVKKKMVEDLFYIDIKLQQAVDYLNFSTQDMDVYNRNIMSVEKIADKQINYNFDSYGRMHTNFTILRSYIRKNCLVIQGDSTFEMDICNSQPLFLCKVMEEEGFDGIDLDELQLYQKLTINGNFYQYIMDSCGILAKREVKEMVYKVFFGKNNNNSAIDKKFKVIFPTIYNFIKKYKKDRDDYRVLSHRLQNLESNFVFNKVIKEMMYVYPEVKLLTCHDSIICSEKYKSILISTFQKIFLKEFQLNF